MDVLLHVLRFWKSIFLLGVFMGGGGYLISAAIPAQWEAVAVVRVGRTLGESIESVPEAIERIRGPSLTRAVATRLGAASDAEVESLRGRIRVQVVGDSISLRVRHGSPDQAKKVVVAIFEELQEQHDAITKDRLDSARANVKNLEEDMEALSQVLRVRSGSDNSFSVARALVLNESIAKSKLLLAPPMTDATQLTQAVSVWPAPVSPKRQMLAVFFAALGVVVALWRAVIRFKPS